MYSIKIKDKLGWKTLKENDAILLFPSIEKATEYINKKKLPRPLKITKVS